MASGFPELHPASCELRQTRFGRLLTRLSKRRRAQAKDMAQVLSVGPGSERLYRHILKPEAEPSPGSLFEEPGSYVIRMEAIDPDDLTLRWSVERVSD